MNKSKKTSTNIGKDRTYSCWHLTVVLLCQYFNMPTVELMMLSDDSVIAKKNLEIKTDELGNIISFEIFPQRCY